MKWICSLVVVSLAAGAELLAQSPPSSGATPAVQTQNGSSSQQLNMQAYIQLLRSDVKKSKSQIVGQVMNFDADQAAAFWPIYQQFEAELSKLGDRTLVLIQKYSANYEEMTDQVADELATELLSIEDHRNELKKQYYQKFKQALDPITATRFLQVENQLERVLDLQIASQLPVIRGGTAQ
jgi:flagellar biosynthesis chaperone FliJ